MYILNILVVNLFDTPSLFVGPTVSVFALVSSLRLRSSNRIYDVVALSYFGDPLPFYLFFSMVVSKRQSYGCLFSTIDVELFLCASVQKSNKTPPRGIMTYVLLEIQPNLPVVEQTVCKKKM